jgi:hypothetical protein
MPIKAQKRLGARTHLPPAPGILDETKHTMKILAFYISIILKYLVFYILYSTHPQQRTNLQKKKKSSNHLIASTSFTLHPIFTVRHFL